MITDSSILFKTKRILHNDLHNDFSNKIIVINQTLFEFICHRFLSLIDLKADVESGKIGFYGIIIILAYL